MTVVEQKWELPKGWAWASIGDVVSKVGSTSPASSYGDQTFKYIDLSSTDGGRVTAPKVLKGSAAPSRARQPVQKGDTLYSCVRVYLGNVALVESGDEDLVASTAFCVLRPKAVDARYLYHYVTWSKFTQRVVPLQRGNSPPAVVDKDVKAQPIPLPPLAEQCRIAAQIDELFAEIADGEVGLVTARKGLEAFRRAVLRASVRGELSRATIGSAMDGDHREVEQLVLPAGWRWTTVGEAGEVKLGRQRSPEHHSGPYMRPYVRVANVFEDRIDLTDVKEMNFSPAEFETFRLRRGDVLLNEGQTPDLLGRPAMWRDEVPDCCFQNTLIRFRARSPITAEWALLVFRHYLHSKRFKRESQITTNIAHLSAGRFAAIEFPVPPPKEAAAIVSLSEELLGSASEMVSQLDAEAANAERLRQSVLKAAFEGHLVPNDEIDRPASALLAPLGLEGSSPSKRRGRAKVTP